MTFGVGLKFLKIVGSRETWNWKEVPRASCAGKETTRTKHIACSYVNSKTLRPSCQSSIKLHALTALKEKADQQKKSAMKIFVYFSEAVKMV